MNAISPIGTFITWCGRAWRVVGAHLDANGIKTLTVEDYHGTQYEVRADHVSPVDNSVDNIPAGLEKHC